MASPSTVRTMYLIKVKCNARKLAHIDRRLTGHARSQISRRLLLP